MKINSYLAALACLLLSAVSFAQTTDIARIEFLHIPFSNSENDISRYRVLLQAPIPINKEEAEFLIIGLEYRYSRLGIEDEELLTPDQVDRLKSLHRMDAYLGYTFKIADNWIMGVRGGARIQSNLERSLISDDFILSGAVYFINDMKNAEGVEKPYRLIFGLDYSSTPGRNFPLPMINYWRQFHPDWTFTLGVPKSNIRKYLNRSHKDALQAFGTLDNIFGNIQNNAVIPGSTVLGENISMTEVLFGLGYEHFFTEHLLYYAYAAHTVYNEFRIRDNTRATAYTINNDNTFYFRTGIKFKF